MKIFRHDLYYYIKIFRHLYTMDIVHLNYSYDLYICIMIIWFWGGCPSLTVSPWLRRCWKQAALRNWVARWPRLGKMLRPFRERIHSFFQYCSVYFRWVMYKIITHIFFWNCQHLEKERPAIDHIFEQVNAASHSRNMNLIPGSWGFASVALAKHWLVTRFFLNTIE